MYIIFGIIMGLFLSAQTAINSQLRLRLGGAIKAALVSFFIGTIFLAFLLIFDGSFSYSKILNAPFWTYLGGFLGAFGIGTNILLFLRLGSIEAAIMPILGQIIAGVLVDSFGLLGVSQKPFTLLKLAGILLVVLGAVLAISKGKTSLNAKVDNAWVFRALGILAGAAMAMQLAINASLAYFTQSGVVASFISFSIGTLALALLLAFPRVSKRQKSGDKPTKKPAIWIYLGGILGGTYVYLSTQTVPVLGTALVVILTLFGLILGSTIIENFGLLGADKRRARSIQIIGLLVLILGAYISKI